jgi:hypothetical protein
MSKKKPEKEAKESKPKKAAAKKATGKKTAVKAPASSVVAGEGTVGAVLAPKPVARKPRAAARSKVPVPIQLNEIALRAYFIAERRHKMGWSGDSTSDWVEAERQLKAEAAAKK